MKREFLLFSIIILLLSFNIHAQGYRAEASLDSSNILIGDHLRVNLKISAPSGKEIIIPRFNEKLLAGSGIDWIENSVIDTIREGNFHTFSQQVTITVFEEGEYLFPAVPVFGSDSSLLAQTAPLPFTVSTIPVDTTAAFMDIKNAIKVPLTFKEVLPYVLITAGIIAILALIVFLILKYRGKKKNTRVVIRKKNNIKPEVAAMNALEKLRHKKLWQEGHVKLYYSELTDILRTYIEERFTINAMEMVSGEIIDTLSAKGLSENSSRALQDILGTADLVKFAKWNPLPDDHDRCFKETVDFIVETTPVNNPVSESKSEEPQNN